MKIIYSLLILAVIYFIYTHVVKKDNQDSQDGEASSGGSGGGSSEPQAQYTKPGADNYVAKIGHTRAGENSHISKPNNSTSIHHPSMIHKTISSSSPTAHK